MLTAGKGVTPHQPRQVGAPSPHGEGWIFYFGDAKLRGARDEQRAGAAISAGLKPRPSGSPPKSVPAW